MPTYEYECSACGYSFERFQSITAPSVRKCPRCGRLKVQRLIGTGSAVIFKGAGFYQTDYRSPEYEKKAKQEKTKAAGEKREPKSSKETKGGKKNA
ncbi:MAG: FmdB family transcriptional regulator [Planctomycetes bacterium DG_23]|nr:MAG: FmdB family transcriptional regulator [Planctomycetes bacterium DG_23]